MRKCYFILGETQAKRGVGKQVWFVLDTVVRSGGQCNTAEILQFLLSFNGNCLSSIYTDTKVYKYEYFFSSKTSNLIIIGFPTNRVSCLKDGPHNRTKSEIERTSKISISQLFKELRIIWECSLSLYSKHSIFHLFSWIGKNWEVHSEQHSKVLKSLCELGKTWNYSLRQTFKNRNFEYMDWELIGKV